jgi:phosphatidate cytidylyltransferase
VNTNAPAAAPARGIARLGQDFKARVGSAVVLVAIGLFGVYIGGIWTGIVAAIFAGIMHFEWASVTDGQVARNAAYTGAVVGATLVAGLGLVLPAVLIAIVAALIALFVRRDAWPPGGIVYAAALGVSLVALRHAPEFGTAALIFLFAVVWATDTGAYFAGRLIGGAKLWPSVSPGKTWAGAIGGTAAGVAAGLLAAALLDGIAVSWALGFVALFLSIAGQLGDLFESSVKRRFGAKDSSHIIPGHGGMMDRLDSLVFAAAFAVLIGWSHAGPQQLARGLLQW